MYESSDDHTNYYRKVDMTSKFRNRYASQYLHFKWRNAELNKLSSDFEFLTKNKLLNMRISAFQTAVSVSALKIPKIQVLEKFCLRKLIFRSPSCQ